MSEEEQRKKFEDLELQMKMMTSFMKTLQDENTALRKEKDDHVIADEEHSARQKRIDDLEQELKTIEDEEATLRTRKEEMIGKLKKEVEDNAFK